MSPAPLLAQAEHLADEAARLSSDVLAIAAEARLDHSEKLRDFLTHAQSLSCVAEAREKKNLGAQASGAVRAHKRRATALSRLAARCDELADAMRVVLSELERTEQAIGALPRFRGVAASLTQCRDRIGELLATERHAIDQWVRARDVIAPAAVRNAAFRRLHKDAERSDTLRTDMDGAVSAMLAASARAAAKP